MCTLYEPSASHALCAKCVSQLHGGEWVGACKVEYAGGVVYEGELRGAIPHGTGKWTDHYGSVYEVREFPENTRQSCLRRKPFVAVRIHDPEYWRVRTCNATPWTLGVCQVMKRSEGGIHEWQ